MGKFVELNHVLRGGDDRVAAPPIGRLLDRLVAGPSRRPVGRAPREDILSEMGTCLHAPRDKVGGGDLASVPLELVANVPGIVIAVQASIRPEILPAALHEPAGMGGRAVLLRTGWDSRWGTGSYRDPGPYLTPEAADVLVDAGTKVVGVDFSNLDDTASPARPVRARLLGAGIPVVEHLTNLGALPTLGFRFYAVPLRITRGASVPVRAFAQVGG